MKKPILVVMAAGMGSRYGGLKQIDPVGKNGEIIMDFSVFDAVQAGFSKVIFIIKEQLFEDFKEVIGDRVSKYVQVEYVFQKLDDLPEGFTVPEGREKPWGTGHAVLAARDHIDAPFVVINADDFYGGEAIKKIGAFLRNVKEDGEKAHWAMVGYHLKNTLTENGHVARGVCVEKDGVLDTIVERTHIEKHGEVISFTEDGESYTHLPAAVPVSMNCWAFSNSMLDELYKRFPAWLDANLSVNPTKCEYFLPFVTNAMIKDGEGTVAVLPCHEQWYGMTYKEDFPTVVNAIKALRDGGVYPEKLLG